MGRIRRLKRSTRARIGFFTGAMVFSIGVWLVDGLGWALIVLGLSIGFAFAVLYDVDEPEVAVRESTLPRPRPIEEWSEQP